VVLHNTRACVWTSLPVHRSVSTIPEAMNQILNDDDFDEYVEGLCQPCYADEGRPGLPPDVNAVFLLPTSSVLLLGARAQVVSLVFEGSVSVVGSVM
jgi:hypothetical protein